MVKALSIAVASLFALLTATSTLEGTWQGKLHAPGQDLTIVFHIVKDANGNLTGTGDSPDQNKTGIPLDVTLSGRDVRIEAKSVFGIYAAKTSEDGKTLTGEWKQGPTLPLSLKKSDEATSSPAGKWEGTLKTPVQNLRLVFHIVKNPDGSMTGTVDSPDQSATGIPIDEVTLSGRSLTIQVKAVGGVYKGTLGDSKSDTTGQWWQGFAAPLTLTKS